MICNFRFSYQRVVFDDIWCLSAPLPHTTHRYIIIKQQWLTSQANSDLVMAAGLTGSSRKGRSIKLIPKGNLTNSVKNTKKLSEIKNDEKIIIFTDF